MELLNTLSESLSSKFGNLLPGVLGALLVFIIGLFLAKIVKKLVERLMLKTTIDEKLSQKMQTKVRIDKFVAKLAYYLVLIYTLLIVLNLLGVESVLLPLEDMMGKFVGYLPNIIGAGIITFAGYLIGTIASEATGFLSERLENLGGKIGLKSSSINLSKLVKQLVFIIVFIPILIIALDTLKMSAISEPATEMLSTLLASIPKIIAAIILLATFYFIGKYIVTIVTDLLSNLGLDSFSEKLGLNAIIGNQSISKMIGKFSLFFIMFTGVIAAADKLELNQLQNILTNVFNISGKIFFGIIILLCGVLVSNLTVNSLSKSADNSFIIPIARFAIVGIFLAFSLHTMGIAESIVNLAFGLTLGSVSVAFALAFGLGGKKAAGKQMEHIFDKIRNKQ